MEDHFSIDVRVCWVIEPRRRRAWIATPQGQLSKVTDGTLRAGEIELPLPDIFDRL